MALLVDKIKYLFRGLQTKRFHTVPGAEPQTVGQHSAGVALLYGHLAQNEATVQGYKLALQHDLGEQFAGDMPAPAKRVLGYGSEMHKLEEQCNAAFGFNESASSLDAKLVKLADYFDGMLQCAHARAQGQLWADNVFANFMGYAQMELQQNHHDNVAFATNAAIMQIYNDAVQGVYPFKLNYQTELSLFVDRRKREQT